MSKHSFSTLLLALVAVIFAIQARADNDYSNAVMSLSPVAYWPLNETTPPPAPYLATNSGTLGAQALRVNGNASTIRLKEFPHIDGNRQRLIAPKYWHIDRVLDSR